MMTGNQQQPNKQRYPDDVKRYNVSSKDTNDHQDSTMVPPVILYTDGDDNQGRRLERNLSQASSNGARLSKYNFLSQAFSQMRNSYAVHANNSTNEPYVEPTVAENEVINMSPVSSPTPSITRKPTKTKYQMYSMYHDSNTEMGSVSRHTPSPTTRESTMTVGTTLHAPLFQRNPKQYVSQINVSPSQSSPEVSEYNTQLYPPPPTSPSASNISTSPKKTSSPYPYF